MLRKAKRAGCADRNGSKIEAQAPCVLPKVLSPVPATPRPGRPARGTRTGRPLLVAFDLLGRRWALRVLWELRAEPLGFRVLRERCDGMSSSVLRDRLAQLVEAGILQTREGGPLRAHHPRPRPPGPPRPPTGGGPRLGAGAGG